MPITTAKTNDSYVIPTSQGSLFSRTNSSSSVDVISRTHDKKKKSIADRLKLSKLFGREDKL